MILSASSPLITTFGMVRWEVCSEAASAAVDRPGVLAIASNVGASALLERPATLFTRWHSAHASRATLRPSCALPTCAACALLATAHIHRRDDEASH